MMEFGSFIRRESLFSFSLDIQLLVVAFTSALNRTTSMLDVFNNLM